MAEEKDHLVSALPVEDRIEEAPETPDTNSAPVDTNDRVTDSKSGRSDSVHVLHNVLRLFTAAETEAEEEAENRRKLNQVIHSMLIVGLVGSTIVIFLGLSISEVLHRPLPSRVRGFRQIIDGLERGSPSSFLDLGILLLIATPILRVVGSLIEFVNRRDWRYAVITSMVLLILAVSVLVGRG